MSAVDILVELSKRFKEVPAIKLVFYNTSTAPSYSLLIYCFVPRNCWQTFWFDFTLRKSFAFRSLTAQAKFGKKKLYVLYSRLYRTYITVLYLISRTRKISSYLIFPSFTFKGYVAYRSTTPQ